MLEDMDGKILRDVEDQGVVLGASLGLKNEAARPVVDRYYPNLFHRVQGALPGVPVKPDPTLLRRLMEELEANPENTLFVGDSDVDIRTARNGGLTGCGVLPSWWRRQDPPAC